MSDRHRRAPESVQVERKGLTSFPTGSKTLHYSAEPKHQMFGASGSCGGLAQLGERYTGSVEVRGSNPLSSTISVDDSSCLQPCCQTGSQSRLTQAGSCQSGLNLEPAEHRPPSSHLRRSGLALLFGFLFLFQLGFPGECLASPTDPIESSSPEATPDSDSAGTEEEIEKPVSKVFIINIHDEIDEVQLESVIRRVEVARQGGADLLVFDMDTPGGELYAAFEIGEFILRIDDIPTVAYVSEMAISAGALIALACDDLVMAPGTTIGDCEPIYPSAGGITTAPEKIQTVIRAKFRAFSQENGYPVLLSQAMVTKELEVVEIRDIETGEVRMANRDKLGSNISPRSSMSGKEDGERVRVLPPNLEILRVVVEEGELLTMTDSEALTLGFSRATVKSVEEAISLYSAAGIAPIMLEFSWSETFARKLRAIKWIFFMLGLLGIFVEMKTPGFGLPGIASILFFGIFFMSSYVAGLAESWEILLFFVGLALIAVEIFFIPGFGVPGIVGVVFVITGLFLSAVPLAPLPLPDDAAAYDFQIKMTKIFLLNFTLSVIVLVIFAYVLSRYLPRFPYLNRLILVPAGPEGHLHGQLTATPRAAAQVSLGDVGESISPLRPSGRARFASGKVDVVTEGGFVPSGQAVRVVEIRGNRVVVGPMAGES